MWSVRSRRSEPSTTSRMCAGRLSVPAIAPLPSNVKPNVVAPALERAGEQLLVHERPIRLCGIEERHAELDRAVDRGDRLALVALLGPAVRKAHPHAPEPDRRHLE